jgi:hypothetical protein
MSVEIDADVEAVVEFMQGRFPAAKLAAIAKGIGAIAPLLWGHYRAEEIELIRLAAVVPTSALPPGDDRPTQSNASE